LLLQLNCIDAWGLLSQVTSDLVSASWNQEWQKEENLIGTQLITGEPIPQALIDAIKVQYGKTIFQIVSELMDTINKTVVLDDDDGIISVRTPPLSVSNAISGVRQAMEMTESYLLWKGDNQFHAIQPSLHSTVSSYSIADLFFSNVEDAAIVIPNRVTFWSFDLAGENWIYGTANDVASQVKVGIIPRNYLLANLQTDARADIATLTALAEGALAKIQGERSQGILVAPMHCAQELLDKISIVDDRYGTPRTTTGYVHRITREYDRGVYRMTLQLGGVTFGYTPPGGAIPTPLAEKDPPQAPSPSSFFPGFLPAYLPVVVDIVFTIVDWDTVSWAEGTIKAADGTVWSINANSLDMANADVYYLYYDVVADTGELSNTQTFGDTISTERILVGFLKRGATTADEPLVVIGSQGKDLFIDKLSAITADLGLITAGEIRVGTGTLGVDFTGWRHWVETGIGRIAGYNNNVLQWYSDTDGKLYAGAGRITLDVNGIKVNSLSPADAGYVAFFYQGTSIGGMSATATELYIMANSGYNLYLSGDLVYAPRFKAELRLRIPVGTDMYD